MRIKVIKRGPYRVSGDVPLYRETLAPCKAGHYVWAGREQIDTGGKDYLLCRCGKTKDTPFCDGAHVRIGFNGTEEVCDASYAERAVVLKGKGVWVADDIDLCSWTRFCHRPGGKVWSLLEKGDPDDLQEIIQGCQECPSGRLTAMDPESGEALEPALPMEIAVTQDPEKEVSGPLVVRGGIPIEAADGSTYEVRNRVTLCRCGQAHNKPFCDARHATTDYNDGTL